MARPYSTFANALSARLSEASCRDAGQHRITAWGAGTVIKSVQRLRRTGSVSPAKRGGQRPKKAHGGAACRTVAAPASSLCGVW